MPAEAFADPWPVDRIPRRQACYFTRWSRSFWPSSADAPLVIHNASFDISFINAELERIKRPARRPGAAGRYAVVGAQKTSGRVEPAGRSPARAIRIDNSRRTKHGALLDARTAGRSVYRPDRGAAVATHPGFGDRSDPGPAATAICRGASAKFRWCRASPMLTVRLTAPLSPPSATSRSGTSISRRLNQLGLAPAAALRRRLPLHVLAVQADEIDGIQHQGRKAAVAHRKWR